MKPAAPASSRPPPQAFRPPPQPRGPNALSALDKARRTHNESIRADGKVQTSTAVRQPVCCNVCSCFVL